MPRDGSGGAGMQLQALPGGDAAPLLAGRVRGRDQGHAPAPGSAREARRPPRGRLSVPPSTRRRAGGSIAAWQDCCRSNGAARWPSSPCGGREAQRALDRAAHRARGRVPRRLRRPGGRLRRADGRRPVVLLGHGHQPVRRRPREPPAPGRDQHGRLPGLRSCRRPVVAAVNGPALAGGFALALLCDLRVAVRPRTLRLSRAPARDPAQLRRGARRAAGDRRPGALPHRPRRSAPRGAAAGDRPRGRLGRRGPARAGARRADRGPAAHRRSSRPSAGRCSSAATSGASSSTRRSASFRRALLGEAADQAAWTRAGYGSGETIRRMWGQT